MTYNSEDYEKVYQITDRVYTKQYGAFFIAFFIVIIFVLFVGLLFFYHTMLIMTNTTTWENTKGSTIDYISYYPLGIDPFDEGLCKNLHHTFFHDGRVTDWTLPDLKFFMEKNSKSFNWRNNQYWKCC